MQDRIITDRNDGVDMRIACFTVDLDRDANILLPDGSAGSTDRGHGYSPRFRSSLKGAKMLSRLFRETGVDATFFAEAAMLSEVSEDVLDSEVAMHGLEHEDLSVMSVRKMERILTEASDTIKDFTGYRPEGFRAPFMRPNPEMYGILEDLGVEYDSSEYADVTERMVPYTVGGLTEVPVPKGPDREGRNTTGYLWPMHEGKRSPQDCIDLASKMKGGIFVIATHSWHMVETAELGVMDSVWKKTNGDNIRKVIEALSDEGFEFMSVSRALRVPF